MLQRSYRLRWTHPGDHRLLLAHPTSGGYLRHSSYHRTKGLIHQIFGKGHIGALPLGLVCEISICLRFPLIINEAVDGIPWQLEFCYLFGQSSRSLDGASRDGKVPRIFTGRCDDLPQRPSAFAIMIGAILPLRKLSSVARCLAQTVGWLVDETVRRHQIFDMSRLLSYCAE